MKHEEITIKLKLSAKYIFAAIALALFVWRPAILESSSITMTSYYPAPYGGYNQLLTTGQSFLGDSGEYGKVNAKPGKENTAVMLGRNGGRVCVGSSTAGSSLCSTNSGSGQPSRLYVFGDTYAGYPISGTNAAFTTPGLEASGSFNTSGLTNLAEHRGIVRVGNYNSSSDNGGQVGLMSNVPISTNKWMYIGSSGEFWTYNNPYSIGTIDSGQYGLLVNSNSDYARDGIAIAKQSGLLSMRVEGWSGGGDAYISAGGSTWLYLGAGSRWDMAIEIPPYYDDEIAFNRKTRFWGDVKLEYKLTLDNRINGTLYSKVYGLCYQKLYGNDEISKCADGWALVGFVPDDSVNKKGFFYVATKNTDGNEGYINPHVIGAGWLTCCAVDMPIVG